MDTTDIRSKLIAPCAIRVFPGDETLFDIGAFLRRLFLFETYIVKSVRLREIPFLVKVFGVEGFLDLLESGVVMFDCDPASIGETTEPGRLGLSRRRQHLSGTEYSFLRVSSDPKKYVSGCFAEFNTSPQLSSIRLRDIKGLQAQNTGKYYYRSRNARNGSPEAVSHGCSLVQRPSPR